ncbi:erythromycin esterase family protein, partial [Steroidobacter sp.]|uniref:erythromycin esterase family protein n=1 Tax=Steroidobacter sp. TaxID=1978227 RepID=UPI001A49A952
GRQFLDQVVGQARVVALGESTHGNREFLLLRNSVFRHLVETQGFTAIAVESDFALATAIDDYVMGQGKLSDELVASVFSFAAPQAWNENRQLLEWIRAYNDRTEARRKIRFYGLEMMGHVLQTAQPPADRPLRSALQYMASVEPASAASFRQRTDRLLAQLVSTAYPKEEGASTPYDKLGKVQQDALTVAIAETVSLFERRQVEWVGKSSRLAYERGYRSALNAAALDADFRTRGWWLSRTGDRGQRDAMSARNLKWALEQEGPQGRVFVFAANTHVTTSDRGCADAKQNSRWTSMGTHAKQWFGGQMVAIASVTGSKGAQCEASCSGIVQLACSLASSGHAVAAVHPGAASADANGFDAVVYVKQLTAVDGGKK